MDDYFKKPGSIPFQWEIRPGVPKHQQKPINHSRPSLPLLNLSPPPAHLNFPTPNPESAHRVDSATKARPEIVESGCFSKPFVTHQQKAINHNRPSRALLKLRPPPPGFNFPTPEPESAPRLGRNRVDSATRAQPEIVQSGCFSSKKRNVGFELDYGSDFETLSSWSESTRKSVSLYCDVPFSQSFSSYKSSPCLFTDPDWVGFGLF